MSAGRFEYTIGFKTDNSGLKQAMDSLKSIQNITTKTPGFSGMSAEIAEAKKGAFDLEQALTRAFNPKMGSVNTVALRNELSKLNLAGIRTDLMKMGPIGETAFNQVAASAMKANLQIKQSNGLITKFGNTLFRNLEWLVSGRIISTVAGVFTKAYGFTKNLDSSLNDIRIVTGKSADEMARFGQEAQKTAMALGKGTTDITNASLIFYQQGLEQEEVDKRTEITTKMANVTGQSTEIVADQMTAVWNGFQAGNDELERYADVMTKVAANTASSSAELAGAISKTASIAKVTGVDMEQLTSMISTVIAVTRDSPETVGTAFKTIFARINDLVEDGTDEFGVSLGRVSSHLAAMGIEILNEDGTLKDLGVTLTEVGEKWSSYSKEQQVAIAEQMGGKRQWGQILALFDHWDDYKDTLLEATEATGSLDSQQEIYMDRVEAHLQQVKTAWEGVYAQIFNEKDIITIADAIKKVLEGVQTFLETVGGFKPVLDMVITMMLQAFGPKMAQEIDRTFSNIKGAFANLETQTAQRDITLMFGNLGDKGLLSELVEHQKTMNRYKDQMNAKDREQYSNYLKQKIELNEQTKILSEQVEKAKEFAQARSEIGQTYAQAGSFDSSAFGVASIEDKLNIIRNLTQGSTADLSMSYAMDTQVEAFKAEKTTRITEIQALIDKLKAYKTEVQNATNNESEINRINKLMEALEGVKDKFTNATTQTEQFKRELNNSTVAAEKAAAELQKVRGATPSTNRTDVLGQFAAGRDNSTSTKFREANTKVLIDTQANVDTYKNLVKDLGNASIFSAEQVGKLNAQLNAQSPEIDKIKAALREELGVSEQGLENIMKVISQHSEGQLRVAEDTRKVLDSAQQSMERSLSFRDQLTNLTRMASLTSQMAMSFNQISNIHRIIKDEDIKGSEKIGRVLSSTAIMLPMLMTTFSRLLNSNIIKDIIESRAKSIEAEAVLEKATQEDVAANQARLKAEEVLQDKQATLEMAQAEIEVENTRHLLRMEYLEEEKVMAMAPAKNLEKLYADTQKDYLLKGYTGKDQHKLQNIENRWVQAQAEGEVKVAQLEAETLAEEQNTTAKTKNIQANITQTESEIEKAQADVVSTKTTQENTAKTLENAEANKIAAKEAQRSAIMRAAAIGLVVAVIAGLIIAYKKIKEAQEEAEEAEKKYNETYSNFIKSQKELRETIQENIKEFGKFKDVWNTFKEGKATIDELNSSMDTLAEKLNKIEDPEYLRLKRIAEYTGQYEDLYTYFHNIEESQESAMERAANYVIDAAKDRIADIVPETGYIHTSESNDTGFLTSNEAKEASEFIKLLYGRGIISNAHASQQHGYTVGSLEQVDFTNLKSYNNIYGITATWNKELTLQQIEWLKQNKKMLEEYAASTNKSLANFAQQALNIVNSTGQEVNQIREATFNKIADKGAKSLTLTKGLDDEDQAIEIEKQLNNYMQTAKQEYFQQTGEFLSPAEQENMRKNILNSFAESAPSKNSIAAIVQTWESNVTPPLRMGLKKAVGKIPGIVIDYSDEAITEIEKNLQESKIELYQIDWDAVSQDETLMREIYFKKGKLLEEDLIKLREYEKNTKSIFENLTQDYDTLIASWENFNNKVEKNKFTKKDYNTKAFKEFFTDEVKEELITVYGATSEVSEAIDTLSNDAIIGSEKWKQAWGVFGDALRAAEIEADIKNVDQALKEMDEYLSIKNKGDIHFLAGVSIEEAEQDIENFINADRVIDIDIETHIESAISELQESYKDLNKIGEKIGEDLTITSEDLAELQKKFPEITKDMQLLSDGTIKLSQTAVDAAKQQAQQELLAETGFQIAKIELQKKLVEEKKKGYEKAAQFALDNAVKEYTNENQLQNDLTTLRDYYEQIEEIEKKQSLAETISYSQEEQKEWQKHYAKLSQFDKEWHSIRISNMENEIEGKLKGEDEYLSNIKDVTYFYKDYDEILAEAEKRTQENSAKGLAYLKEQMEELELDPATIADYWTQAALANLRAAHEQQNIIDDLTEQQNDLEVWAKSYSNSFLGWGKEKDKNTKSTKEAAEKEAELRDVLKEEIDAYHDVNLLIAKHRQELEQLQKAQDKLTGQSLIDNLNQQKKRYQDLNAVLEEKLRLNNEDAAYYRSQLQDQGVTFDEEGYISNDNAIRAEKLAEYNDAIVSYNDMSYEDQNANKDWLDDRKQEYEDFKKLIEKYEKLKNPGEEIDKTLEEIQENLLKEFELDIEIVNTKYQIKLDKGEIKRAEIQLQKDLQKIQDSDVLGNVVIDIKTLLTFDETEEGKQLKENFEKIKEQYEYYINNNMDPPKQIEEAYKEVLESWTKYVSERTQQIEDIVTKSFDRLSKKLDRQKTQFETIDKIFEHDINLVKLRYGENAYQQLEELYRARERVSKAQLENTKLQVEVLQNALREAQEKNLGQDVINDLEDKLAEAYEAQRAMLEEHLNFLKEQSNQAIDEVFNHLSEQMAGVSLKDMKDQWDWVNRDSDDYYDTINAAYELEKLRTQMKKAINETDDVSTQQALNDLMNNELANLQQKDKLSKYDLERANALFDVEQKRAAFREAQNNKSKMRLRRDSSGNYSYQFVSDEDKITTAMQDLADAQNQLYNIDKEAYKNNLDKLYEYYFEYREKLKEANNDEERAEITKNYLNRIVILQTEHFNIIDNLEQNAAKQTGKRFEEMAQAEKDTLMGDVIPAWSSAWATMVRDSNFEKFLAINGAEASDIAAEFELKSDAAIQDITGTTLEDIANGIDPAVKAIDSMVESTKNLSTELYDLLAILSTLPSAFDNNVESIDSLIATAKDRYNNLMAERNSTKDSINKTKMTDKSIREIDLTVPKESIEIDKTLDNTSILTKTLKIISDKMDKFYTDQISLLKLESTKSSLNSVYNTNVNSSTPTLEAPIYIDANFPAVNSAQEIKDALNMLVNQATQKAFNTLR